MATETDQYLITIDTKLTGDDSFKILTREVERLNRENQRLVRSSSQATRGVKSLGRAGGNAASGFSRHGSLFQNLSYQVTDFAVQTQGGVSALRSFSQQAPQVAGALGAAGIGGAFGLVAFAVGSLAAALAPAIIAMGDFGSEADKLNSKLKELEKNKVDVNALLANVSEATLKLEGLSAAGIKFAGVFQTIIDLQNAQKLQLATDLLKANADAIAELVLNKANMDFGPALLGSVDGAKKALTEFNKLKDISNELAVNVKAVFSAGSKGGREDAMLALQQTLQRLSSDAKVSDKDLKALKDSYFALFELFATAGQFNPLSSSAKGIKNLSTQWDALVRKLKTPLQLFTAEVASIQRLGDALGKTGAEVDALISAATKTYSESVFKSLVADTETFTGGVYSAVDAIGKLNVSTEYLAGLRQTMSNYSVGSDEWYAIADALGRMQTPAEHVQVAIADIRKDSGDGLALRIALDELTISMNLTSAEVLALEKNLFKAKEAGSDFSRAVEGSVRGSVSGLVSTLTSSEKSFGDWAKSLIKSIADVIAQLYILKAIQSATGANMGVTTSAKGNVFSDGNVVPFASGGVVSTPTIFPLASGGVGLMGEAGSEAIMPLSRNSNGDLGVEAQVNVNVKNYGNDNVSVQQNGSDVDIIIGRISRDILIGGPVAQSLEQSYGVSRSAGAY